MEVNERIYRNIKFLCCKKGIPIGDIEDVIHRSHGYLSRYARGQMSLSMNAIHLICNKLEVNTSDLFIKDLSMETHDKSSSNDIDIHKLIDDAMEKKDRNVNIYISEHGTSIYVNPIRDEDEPHWIVCGTSGSVKCSCCGNIEKYNSLFCPRCGEQMHGVKVKT